MKLTQKNLLGIMDDLYEADKESYDELWHSMQVLNNLGLIEDSMVKAMIREDRKLWNIENVENA